ncbi:helix-turn-helix domain-containing protein [Candidatus Enterococcus murrayae]|uniref:Helix-turn-helix transcriptional regulator n=1 Tax=Candidatus Enterococcus murrayae TaxID=2815321 RepID=A0ABS3HFN4_9ENTE|nr:helix-turn-helix transcriptional regulator [Enterococcus sp. MJM16]MBO0452063.1 helix-turn-helix transcriptional regulator [Enterococcus sp. MJM16]
MMQSSLLSICRLINMMNPTLTEPQNSVVAVNIDREAMEEIRKRKGVPIRTLERRINLSKSRYYRWLRYQTDLPLELVMGLKKVLNMSDRELLNLFVSSTDEQIQMLGLVIYTSMSNQETELKQFLNLRKSLGKFKNSSEDNNAYKLILTYADLVVHCRNGEPSMFELRRIGEYFTSIDYFTLFDILLYLATLRISLNYSFSNAVMEKESIILENSLLKKFSSNQSNEWKDILIGCVIDLSLCFVDMNNHEQAIKLLNKATVILKRQSGENRQTKEIFQFLAYLYVTKDISSEDTVIKKIKHNMSNSSSYLPRNEFDFFKNLSIKEKCVFE